MINDTLRNRHKKVSPRLLKKASRVTNTENAFVKIAGHREATETGYIVEGYRGKNFETYFEVMLGGTASPFLHHPKKDRAIWILNGRGFLTTERDGEPQLTRKVITGDHVAIERGTTYRIATTATEELQMFVVQSYKYDASLEIKAPSDALKSPEPHQLKEPTEDERLGTIRPSQNGSRTRRRNRHSSKAAQQQARRHKKSLQVEETDAFRVVPDGAASVNPDRPPALSGINAQPSGGKFDDSGAG